MKYRTLSKSAFAVTALLLACVAAACAGSLEEVPTEATPETTETVPPTTLPPPSLPPKDAAPPETEKKCTPSCKTDTDCQNSCPAVSGGVQCCDVKAGVCWGSKTPACPKVEPVDASNPPVLY